MGVRGSYSSMTFSLSRGIAVSTLIALAVLVVVVYEPLRELRGQAAASSITSVAEVTRRETSCAEACEPLVAAASRAAAMGASAASRAAVVPPNPQPLSDASAARRARQRLVAPFMFPQLYRCPDPVAIQHAAQGAAYEFPSVSQSREDIFLWQKVFAAQGASFPGSVFVEIGALDGAQFSNTLQFETLLGSRGLLVEAHPDNSVKLRTNQVNRPNSVIVTAAICGLVPANDTSGSEDVGTLQFTSRGGATGAGVQHAATEFLKRHGLSVGDNPPSVDCLPMQDLLDTTGLLDVDFFSLGVY